MRASRELGTGPVNEVGYFEVLRLGRRGGYVASHAFVLFHGGFR